MITLVVIRRKYTRVPVPFYPFRFHSNFSFFNFWKQREAQSALKRDRPLFETGEMGVLSALARYGASQLYNYLDLPLPGCVIYTRSHTHARPHTLSQHTCTHIHTRSHTRSHTHTSTLSHTHTQHSLQFLAFISVHLIIISFFLYTKLNRNNSYQ